MNDTSMLLVVMYWKINSFSPNHLERFLPHLFDLPLFRDISFFKRDKTIFSHIDLAFVFNMNRSQHVSCLHPSPLLVVRGKKTKGELYKG